VNQNDEANMRSPTRDREIVELTEQLAVFRATSERLWGIFAGLALMFGFVTATVAMGGVMEEDPMFAIGAGLALASTVAFALCAYDIGSTRRTLRTVAVAAPRRVIAPLRRAA
jgi:hypothetical protein